MADAVNPTEGQPIDHDQLSTERPIFDRLEADLVESDQIAGVVVIVAVDRVGHYKPIIAAVRMLLDLEVERHTIAAGRAGPRGGRPPVKNWGGVGGGFFPGGVPPGGGGGGGAPP